MTTSSNSAAAAHTATTKLSAPNTHCLDPLSAAELSAARATAVAHLRSQHGVSEPRFSFITLHESSTQRLSGTSGTRVAEVVVHLPPTIPHVLLIHLDASTENEDGSDNDISAVVASDVALPAGTQPPLTPDDCELAEQIALKDDTLRRVVAKSGLDIARVVCDPWSVHMADDIDDQIQLRSSPSSVAKTEAGANGAEGQDMRLVQLFLYYRLGGDADAASIGKWNHYSHPLYWVPLVDLASRTVVTIHGTDCADLIPEKSDDSAENAVDGVTINAENASNGYNAIPPLPTDAVNYTPETLGANTYLSKEPVPRGLKRLEASQPDGASFTLSGHTLVWDQWNLHVGFNYREGVVIHDMKFGGRSIAARASLVEMAVPYADPRQPFQRKCAFDVSDYGLGYCTTSLQLNCDCVGHIAYMDATLTDTNGEPYVIPNAVCIHEEDAGTACKHVEYRTGVSYTRRARRLVVSFVATVVNYEYLFYFWFHVDGSWGLDIKLSGMLSTNLLANDERAVNPATGIENGPSHGTLVAPGVNAQWHQHMFCARVEPAVDGALNCVSEFNVTYAQSVANGTGGDRFGNAFGVVETPLSEERQAVRDNAPGRWWRVFNQAKRNEIARKPVGYKFAFKSMGWMPNLLASDDSVVGRRARFAQHNVWVTKWRETQRFPAGEFPTQGTGVDDGEEVDVKQDVKTWVEDSEERLVDERLVLWLSFGVVHVPRVEDFPVMPCEEVGFVFKPDCFMLGNPVVDMDEVQARDSKSLCCGNGDEVHSDLFKRDASLVNDAALVRFMKEGASGRIYKAADGDSGRAIAVKIVDYFDNENKEETMEEARIHSTLDHKNIIKLHKYYTNKNSLIMHLEYFDGFDLSDIISAGSPVNREEAMRISGDVISALKYMHDKNITHNDVHEGNVMINSEGHVKLVDFGCAASETSAKSIDILKAESIFQRLCPVGSLDQFMYPAKKIKRKKKTNMLMTF